MEGDQSFQVLSTYGLKLGVCTVVILHTGRIAFVSFTNFDDSGKIQ